MIKTITEWDFVKSFDDVNRSSNFSVAGRKALFEMLEEINPDMELDPIAICCDFTEYPSLEEWKEDYGYEPHDEDVVPDASNAPERPAALEAIGRRPREARDGRSRRRRRDRRRQGLHRPPERPGVVADGPFWISVEGLRS